MKKLIISSILTLGLISAPIMASASSLNGWLQNSNGTLSYYQNNYKVHDGLAQIENKCYMFDSLGNRVSGWVYLSDGWYYFNNSGIMQTGWFNLDKDWYYLDNGGKMLTGEIYLDGKWYNLATNGKLIF